MPRLLRAMTIHAGPSGLPTDRYVNNFFFGDVDTSPTAMGTISTALDNFWDGLNTFIPEGIVREDYRVYDMADPTPRPVTFFTPGSQPTGEATALPHEVAVCLSYYHERNVPRQRGRVFIGPLTMDAMTVNAEETDPRPHPTFRTALVTAAQELQAIAWGPGGAGSIEMPWVVYSPTNGTHGAITDVWVDDAFDTMRSRGVEPSTRTTLNVVPD